MATKTAASVATIESYNNIETKLEKFLFHDQKRQMVTGEFIAFRNVGRDAEIIKLVSQLQQETKREDGLFMMYYATRRVYTLDLQFKWHRDTPYYLRALEDYWNMVLGGTAEKKLYEFYVNNLSNTVSTEWTGALDRAQKIWTPPEEGWDDEVDEEGNPTGVDPNS